VPEANVPDPGPEDLKLVTLARSVRARTRAAQGAAVRDTDGRTYVAASVDLASLSLTALQLAVAMAVSSGALGLEAAVILGDDTTDEAGVAVLRDVAPSATVFGANADGTMAG
jgi:trehalose-6-phosphatase